MVDTATNLDLGKIASQGLLWTVSSSYWLSQRESSASGLGGWSAISSAWSWNAVFSDNQITVCRNLLSIGQRYQALDGVPQMMHLCIPHQESSWNDQAVGDGGVSHGPYQIDTDAHPQVTAYFSTSPWWDYGFAEIHDRWRETWAAHAIDWTHASQTVRIQWFVLFAHEMQGSIKWTMAEAQAAYSDSLAMLEILT